MQKEFDRFLQDISQCFLKRDFELWRSRLLLPFSIVTKHRPVVLPDEGSVRRNFDLYLRAIDTMGLDLIDRHCTSLDDCQDGTWLGSFQTRLVRDGQLATGPYTATALLHVKDGRFRMSSMLNGRGHSEWTGIKDA